MFIILGFYKFKILSSVTKKQIVALGGINLTNVKKLKMLNLTGFAGIGYFDKVKKKAP